LWFIEHGRQTTATRQLQETRSDIDDTKAELTALSHAVNANDKPQIEQQQQLVLDYR
jgi:hypothetical protein